MFFIRLTRIIPFVIVLAVVAALIYLIARFRLPSAHAKNVVIQFFTAITAVLSVAMLLIALYGAFDGNEFAVELFGSFFVAALLGLIITRICNWRFVKKYPQYAMKAQNATTRTMWDDLKMLVKNLKTAWDTLRNLKPPMR